MDSSKLSKEKDEELNKNKNKSEYILGNLKGNYFLMILFDFLHKRKSLEIIKYNKKIQQRINLDINAYKEYSETYSSIEIDIIPFRYKYGQFINIKKEEESYFHIYFNNNYKEEIKKYFLENVDNKVKIINIIIDHQVISFEELFKSCACIKSLNFKKFYRNNINNISYMFSGCTEIKELDLSNFKADNVTDMSYLFFYCLSLKKINTVIYK